MLPKPLVWLTGNICDPALAPATAWLAEAVDAEIVEPARAAIADGRFPAGIVIFQSYPGQISPRHVAPLRELAPFAQVVWVLGAWCEGQLRLELPGEVSPRLYWHECPARLPPELGFTISLAQRTQLTGAAAVSPVSRASYLALAAALEPAGLAAVWHGREQLPAERLSFLVIDGWQACPAELLSAPAPALLLLDWPRPEDLERAARLGI